MVRHEEKADGKESRSARIAEPRTASDRGSRLLAPPGDRGVRAIGMTLRRACTRALVALSITALITGATPLPVGFPVYPRVAGAIENSIRIRLGPLAPVLAPFLLVQVQPRLHISPRDLEPIRSVARLGAPVLVVAGSRDQHTTLAESEELFRAAVQPKRLWVVSGARHQDFLSVDPTGYGSQVVGFLLEHLRPGRRTTGRT